MAGLLALGVAGLLADRRWVRVAGLVALVAASAVRHNAPAATLPLIVILFELAPSPPTWRGRITRYAISTAAWLGVTVASLGINGALTDKPMHFWASSLALADIVGTLAHVDGTIPDTALAPLLTPTDVHVERDFHVRLRAAYSPFEFSQLVLGDERLWDMPITGDTPRPRPSGPRSSGRGARSCSATRGRGSSNGWPRSPTCSACPRTARAGW